MESRDFPPPERTKYIKDFIIGCLWSILAVTVVVIRRAITL